DIYLKHGLGNLAAYDFRADKENLKLTMLIESIRLLEKDETGFTSVKFLADSLKEMGYPMHKKKFVTYMEHLLDLGLVEKTGIYHYPYRIVASRQQLRDVEKNVHRGRADWRNAGNGLRIHPEKERHRSAGRPDN
ncbi:MAG: hypothetical protein ACLVAW_22245, partial [Eisenbergiella massiliensis]